MAVVMHSHTHTHTPSLLIGTFLAEIFRPCTDGFWIEWMNNWHSSHTVSSQEAAGACRCSMVVLVCLLFCLGVGVCRCLDELLVCLESEVMNWIWHWASNDPAPPLCVHIPLLCFSRLKQRRAGCLGIFFKIFDTPYLAYSLQVLGTQVIDAGFHAHSLCSQHLTYLSLRLEPESGSVEGQPCMLGAHCRKMCTLGCGLQHSINTKFVTELQRIKRDGQKTLVCTCSAGTPLSLLSFASSNAKVKSFLEPPIHDFIEQIVQWRYRLWA